MKKILLLLVFILIFSSGCAAAPEVSTPEVSVPETAAPETAIPEVISHSCENSCAECDLCTNAACGETPCEDKCIGHKEEPYAFSTGDYISDSPISVQTDTFVFDIGADIYVPGNLEDLANTLETVMEEVSGLDFEGAGYSRNYYPDGKIHFDVSRESIYSWDGILPTNEVGLAYGEPQCVLLSPGDLFLGNSKAIAHELSHVLMYRQSEWNHCQLLNEGFAEYTTYLTMLEFDKQDGKVGFSLDRPVQSITDMVIYDYEKLYEQALEFWFENTFEYSGNGNYVIGFRFMAYLHEIYGDYSKWITEFENTYNFKTHSSFSNESTAAQQIEVLKAVYGEDVLDNFYPWLKANVARFDDTLAGTTYRNLTDAQGINLYPHLDAIQALAAIVKFEYNNLYINIDCLRTYLREYKGLDDSGLVLITSKPVTVNLYHADGSYTSVMSDSDNLSEAIKLSMVNSAGYYQTEQINTGVRLDDVSYIKLVGEGELEHLEIYGQFTQHFDIG